MHPRIQRYFPVFPDGNIQSDFQFLPLLLFFSDMLCSANIRYNIHTEDRYAKMSLRSFSLLHAFVLFCLICICHTHHRIFYDFCLITVLYPIKNRIISIICNTDKIIRIQTFRLLCNRYRNYLKQEVKHCAYVQYCKCQHIPCSCL